jgi:phage tail-like protein
MSFSLPPTSSINALELPMTHRFSVLFITAGIPNLLDIRFKSVSGIGAKIEQSTNKNAANPNEKRYIPKGIKYNNLILSRGLVPLSILSKQIEDVFNEFKFCRSDVMVVIHSEIGIPTGAWIFYEAYPVSWSMDTLDATSENVLIDKLELTYSHMKMMRI